MMTIYATTDVYGPISVRLPSDIGSAPSPLSAAAEWVAAHGRESIDNGSTDAEDDLAPEGWEGWSEDRVHDCLRAGGYAGRPLSEGVGSNGLPTVVAGTWWIWSRA